MADINEELRVLVTAEVDKAIKNLKSVDKQTGNTEKLFKKLGGSIGAAFSVKAVIDFGLKSAEAYKKQKQAVSVLNSVLESTGAAAWTSSSKLQEMASSLQKVTNYGDETILSMQQVLLGFKNIKGDNFEHATKAILDMATVMKMDLGSAAQVVGKALDDPINGLDSLRRQGFFFTEQQKKMIQTMIEAGDVMGAQKLILDELDGSYGGAAEAAADYGTQIKNAWGDVTEGFGKVFEGLAKNSGILQWTLDRLNDLADAFNNVERNAARLGSGEQYTEWYESLSNTDKLKEATEQLRMYKKEYQEALKLAGTDENAANYYSLMQQAESKHTGILHWQEKIDLLKEAIRLEKLEAAGTEARKNAEEEIDKVLAKTESLYKSLAKNSPAAQLAELEKQLDEISKTRFSLNVINIKPLEEAELAAKNTFYHLKTMAEISGKMPEEMRKQLDEAERQYQMTVAKLENAKSHNLRIASIDKKGLVSELDEAERIVREKMAKIKADGKKTWQEIFSDTTGVDKSLFKNGKQAAEQYLKELAKRIKDGNELDEAMGKKISLKKSLEEEAAEIESTIKKLISIPEKEFLNANGGFETKDAAIQKLIERYKELAEAIKNAADEKPPEPDWDSFDNLAEKLGALTEFGLNQLDMFDAKTNQVIGNLAESLAQINFDSVLSGFQEFGKALGEGEDASDAMQHALASMAQEILNQLPLLFMQAGLSLIAQGQWAIGLGLMAAGLADSIVAGFVNGRTEGAEVNALGGVYGDDSYSAFAKGGTFTNQVVAKPTYFRFAKGSGFGTGLMGEAGPEAIMPLTRGADGSLGVSARGIGGGDVQVNIPVTVYSDEPVEVHDTEDENGQRKIEILVGSMINQHLAGGKADKALKSRYGLKVQGV